MIEWMTYVVLVTLTLSAAALAAERAAKVHRAATRWVWIASLIGSLLLPTVMATASIRFPKALAPNTTSTSAPIALRNATSIPMPPVLLDLGDAQPYEASVRMDTLIRDSWVTISLLMALAAVASSLLLHRRKRDWREGILCNEQVLVAPDAGPAVVGLWRSRIVVPAWLLQACEEQQQSTIAHERSHLRARDPQLIALALVLLILMPWNALLWWQFHRLRRAIEVDCDARVLRDGHDVATYCETLIQVGQRQSSRIGVVPAMSGSASSLELRIRLMLRKQKKWAHASGALLVCISLGMAALAAQVTPPATSHRDTNFIDLGSDTLDRYTGFYQNDSLSLITVTRAGHELTVSVSGAIGVPNPFHIVPTGEARFAVEGENPLGVSLFPGDKPAEPTVQFITGSHGRALRLVAYQNGRVILDQPRIDKAVADRINDALAARIKALKPFPTSEKALQLFLSDPDSSAGMGDSLAWVRAHNKDAREKFLAELGPVESYTFKGVTKFGSDDYLVKHKHGMETVLLMLDEHGILVSALQFDSRSRFAQMDLIPAT